MARNSKIKYPGIPGLRFASPGMTVTMRWLLVVLLLLPVPAAAQTAKNEAELRRIEQQQREKEKQSKELARSSEKIKTEVEGLKKKLVTVSARLAEHEEKLEELQKELVNIEQEEKKYSTLRKENQKDLSEVLAIVLRLSRLPPEAMVFAPTEPKQTIYTSFGMQVVMKELNQRVLTAREQLSKLSEVRARLREQRAAVTLAEAKINADRSELAGLVKQREEAQRKTDKDRAAADAEAKKLAARAADLRDLIKKLQEKARQAKKPKVSGPALYARGSARLPVAGKVIRGYGQVDPAGNRSRGLTVSAPSRAVVNAPRAGNVAFAGAFRSYGQVVIIEIADGQHILLTGLGSISVSEGESVKAGEPVGRMPEDASPLYLETRKDGEPVDPATYGLTQS